MSSRFGVPERGRRTAIPPVYERQPLAVVGFPKVQFSVPSARRMEE
jgi:hypothetical protein